MFALFASTFGNERAYTKILVFVEIIYKEEKGRLQDYLNDKIALTDTAVLDSMDANWPMAHLHLTCYQYRERKKKIYDGSRVSSKIHFVAIVILQTGKYFVSFRSCSSGRESCRGMYQARRATFSLAWRLRRRCSRPGPPG